MISRNIRKIYYVFEQRRFIKILSSPIHRGLIHYASSARFVAGKDVSTKHTEFFDGGTDDFGTFKEGPPSVIRLEYLRSPEHKDQDNILHKSIWSPFEVDATSRTYSPLHHDYSHHSSIDKFGHRTGTYPGGPTVGHWTKGRVRPSDERYYINSYPLRHIPKWLSTIVNDQKRKRFIGFFLYANGAYVAELLTYKQLPRLIYNKPFQGCIPTIGQTVTLNEVTYGKEVHTLSFYPNHYGAVARSDGSSAVVLRGSEPDLVPMLLPSKEIRLFDSNCTAVFGRRAGVLREHTRIMGFKAGVNNKLQPTRPRLRMKSLQNWHAQSGGNGTKAGLKIKYDWKMMVFQNVKAKNWLNPYTVKAGNYVKHKPTSELKSKTYSWASRDPLYTYHGNKIY